MVASTSDLLALWSEWTRPSAGLPVLWWALLVAAAAAVGQLVQRYAGLPKVVGYSLVGTAVGLAGFEGARWPLQGTALFLVELGVAIALFEAGGRLPVGWFRHNPMVLAQSLTESALSYFAVRWTLRALGLPDAAAAALAVLALAASPAVLTRVVIDTHACGPVTDRTLALATLNTLYALVLGCAHATLLGNAPQGGGQKLYALLVVLGLSFVVGALMALALRSALRVMSPASENTSILVLALIGAGGAVAAYAGGSAPLAALVGGVLLKLLNPRPWVWPQQLGTAASLVTMLMFVLVSVVAAQGGWSLPVAAGVVALVGARALAKVAGVALANYGSGTSWRQALWIGLALTPMSAVTLLIACGLVAAQPSAGAAITQVALPAILLMEVVGAVLATLALHRSGESVRVWRSEAFERAVEPRG